MIKILDYVSDVVSEKCDEIKGYILLSDVNNASKCKDFTVDELQEYIDDFTNISTFVVYSTRTEDLYNAIFSSFKLDLNDTLEGIELEYIQDMIYDYIDFNMVDILQAIVDYQEYLNS